MSEIDFYSHESAIVESKTIGKGTRILAFVHVLPGARIGADCSVHDHVFIENDVVVGDRVTVKSGVQLWDGLRLEDDVFVGPNVAFTNDRWPRSKQWPEAYPTTLVQKGASIGANATILPGITIGQSAMIGAGAVVTRSVPPNAVVIGNPARIVSYAGLDRTSPALPSVTTTGASESAGSKIDGVVFDFVPVIRDLRGDLSAREVGRGLQFIPKRYFIVSSVPSKSVRGEHAHKLCHQLLISLNGEVACVVDDGENRAEYILDTPEKGLYIPPMIWATQYKYSRDCVLLVLASHEYDPHDYIREYETFMAVKKMS